MQIAPDPHIPPGAMYYASVHSYVGGTPVEYFSGLLEALALSAEPNAMQWRATRLAIGAHVVCMFTTGEFVVEDAAGMYTLWSKYPPVIC